METNLIIIMKNDYSKKEIKPLMIVDNLDDAHKIIDAHKVIASIAKNDVEYYVEVVPMVHC